MKILSLTIKKKWYDMIDHDIKPEEYRKYNSYWITRLMIAGHPPQFRTFDAVMFANGGHFGNVPKQLREFKGIEIRTGKPEWGAEPGKKYFVIKLGEKIDNILGTYPSHGPF